MGRKKSGKAFSKRMPRKLTRAEVEKKLAEYYGLDQFNKSIRGASSAWEGFQRQTVYICSRIAECQEGEFYPETVEDLAVLYQDGSIELVQVKSVTNAFSLSRLTPGGRDSFFSHVYHFYHMGISVIPKIVVFGQLGKEMSAFIAGEETAIKAVKDKLSKSYSQEFASFIVKSLKIDVCDEEDLRGKLPALVGSTFEGSIAPDLVCNELTVKVEECSRNRTAIKPIWLTRASREISQKAASLRGYRSQYGVKLNPLSEVEARAIRSDEKERYRLGESASLKHIVAGYDVLRPRLSVEIEKAFQRADVVLVRGVSGQGKSTACYRYLFEKGLFWCFEVAGDIDERDALEIAACLRGLSQETEETIYVYIDGAVGLGWALLARELCNVATGIKLLVSIREDDLGESCDSEWKMACASVHVELTERDAREIYNYFDHGQTYPSFEESWKSFGGEGPMMEYVFSVTQGTSLRAMLAGQLGSIVQKSSDEQLQCLYLASILGAEGASVSVRSMRAVVQCENLTSFIARIADEHFVRDSQNGELFPLHPLRSKIIAEELGRMIGPLPANDLFLLIIHCGKGPIGRVLASHFDQQDAELVDFDAAVKCIDSWSVASEVLKFVLWADTRAVFVGSQELRKRCSDLSIAPSFACMLSGGIVKREKKIDVSVLLELVKDQEKREDIKRLLRDFENISFSPRLSKRYLNALQSLALPCPMLPEDMKRAGFVYGVIGIMCDTDVATCCSIPELPPSKCIDSPLDALLEYALGVQLLGAELSEEVRGLLRNRIDRERHVIWSHVENGQLHLFQVGLDDGQDCNDSLVSALCAYRELYPNLTLYAGSLLGTDSFLPEGINLPDGSKSIPAENLPIGWSNIPNYYYRAMCEYDEAPNSWSSMRGNLAELGSLFVTVMTEVSKSVTDWYQAGCFLGLSKRALDAVTAAQQLVSGMKLDLPKQSLDPKGYVVYGSAMDVRQVENVDAPIIANGKGNRRAVFQQTRKAINALSMFLQRACQVILQVKDVTLGKDNAARMSILDLASMVELSDSVRNECFETFGYSISPLAPKDEILSFLLLWSTLCFVPLTEKSAPLLVRSRLKKLKAAPERILGLICQREGIVRVPEADGARISILLSDDTPSFEELFDDAVRGLYPHFDEAECYVEQLVLPNLIKSIRVDYYLDGCYVRSEGYSAAQLVHVGKRTHPALSQPEFIDDLVDDTKHDARLDLWKTLSGLEAYLEYIHSVDSEIIDVDEDLLYLDADVFSSWKNGLISECTALVSSAKKLLLECGTACPDGVRQKVDLIERGLNWPGVDDNCEFLLGIIREIKSQICSAE